MKKAQLENCLSICFLNRHNYTFSLHINKNSGEPPLFEKIRSAAATAIVVSAAAAVVSAAVISAAAATAVVSERVSTASAGEEKNKDYDPAAVITKHIDFLLGLFKLF